MGRDRLVLVTAMIALSGCAEMGQVVNSAIAQATAPPVFYEGFEVPVTAKYTVYRAGQSFTTQQHTWQVTAASIDVANASTLREVVAGDGTQVVDLAGSPGAGSLSTSFPTTAGQRYTLSFRYGRNNRIGAAPARARVEVIGAVPLLRADLQHGAPTPYDSLQTFSMAFAADSPSTTLQLSGLTEGNAGLTVDAVAVRSGAVATVRNLSGDYVYLGQGSCNLKQLGTNVRMFCTWAPAGTGPHYEIRGTLAGDTIEGEWYSHYAKQGWYRYVGHVLPDGSIEQSRSDDPIRSNIKTAVLTPRR